MYQDFNMRLVEERGHREVATGMPQLPHVDSRGSGIAQGRITDRGEGGGSTFLRS